MTRNVVFGGTRNVEESGGYLKKDLTELPKYDKIKELKELNNSFKKTKITWPPMRYCFQNQPKGDYMDNPGQAKKKTVLKRPTGRPSKINPKLVKRICDMISNGSYIITACQAVGISQSSYMDWKRKAQAGDARFQNFLAATQKAQAIYECSLVEKVNFKANEDRSWIGGLAVLSRRFPDRWQDTSKMPVQQAVAPVQVVVKQFQAPAPAIDVQPVRPQLKSTNEPGA